MSPVPTVTSPGPRAAGAAALLAACLFAGAAEASEPAARFEPIRYATRELGEVDAERSTLTVPENRHRTGSPSIELTFVRLRRSGAATGPPIVYLAGGPGGSGVEAGRGARFRLFDALRASGDVILFDQRGTGSSSPIEPEECSTESRYPLEQPLELVPYLELVERHAAACARLWREAGVDLDAYDTVESADDIEALRRVLGADQLDLLGISYGTHLAIAYMRRYPERLRRAVLAGVEGPDHTVKLPSQFERQLDALDALSGGAGETRSRLERVLGALERQPVTLRIVSVEGPDTERRLVVGRRDLAAVVMNLLRDPGSMVHLPAVLARLEEGDFTDVSQSLESLRRLGGLEAMPEAMDAASGISAERRRRIEREDETTLLGSGVLLANLATTRGLGVADLGDAFREPLTSTTPTLFISGGLDGRTPPSNAEEVMSGFSRAHHLVIENGGHGNDLLLGAALEPAIVGFFLGRAPDGVAIARPAPDPASIRKRRPLSPADATRYVGEYERREGEIWRVLHQFTVESLGVDGEAGFSNAVLQLRWSGDGFPFHPISETDFYIDFPWFVDDRFRFELDRAGNVTHLVHEGPQGEVVRMEKVH